MATLQNLCWLALKGFTVKPYTVSIDPVINGEILMSNENLLDYVIKNLKDSTGTWPKISTDTGIPYHTLIKIATKKIKDPGFSKVNTLQKYFKSREDKKAA